MDLEEAHVCYRSHMPFGELALGSRWAPRLLLAAIDQLSDRTGKLTCGISFQGSLPTDSPRRWVSVSTCVGALELTCVVLAACGLAVWPGRSLRLVSVRSGAVSSPSEVAFLS